MNGYVNKRDLLGDLPFLKLDYETREKIRSFIEQSKEIDLLDRDQGMEPILEDGSSVYHESLSDGTGRMVQKEFLDWKCPICGWFVGELYCGNDRWHVQGEASYCARCGQKIDWTKPSAEEKQRYELRKAAEREQAKERGYTLDNMYESRRKKYGVE